MKNRKKSQIAAIFLSLILVLTMMPSAAFGVAEEGEAAGSSAVTGEDAGSVTSAQTDTENGNDTETSGTETSGTETNGTEADKEAAENADSGAAAGTQQTAGTESGNDAGAGAQDTEGTGTDTAEETGKSAGGEDTAISNNNEVQANGIEDQNAVSAAGEGTDVLGDAAGTAGDSTYPEGFTMSIPVLKIKVTKGYGEAAETGKAAIDAMNASDDHSYRCTGTMDVEVPEGFAYSDQAAGTELRSMTGLTVDYIRGRGNSSWDHKGKRPYKIKLNKKTSLLGMTANKHWALIANAFDPSMMRNRLTYWLGRQLNMDFTPEAYPVDVFIGSDEDGDGDGEPDGYEHYGCYLLTHIPKNLIKIDQPAESVTDGKALTGGYLLSMMQDGDSDDVFVTKRGESLQNILPSYDKDLDEDAYDNDTQKNYIRNYVQEAEHSLFEGETADDSDPSGYRKLDYHDYFDMNSASLYWMMQFFTDNGDAYSTGSTYFYKTKDTDTEKGKIFWGPLWDFDFAWNFADSGAEYDNANVMSWMVAMLGNNDGEFTDLCRDNWTDKLRPALIHITEKDGLIDQYYKETMTSQGCDYALNHEKYTSETGDGTIVEDLAKDYKGEVEKLREWINKRIARMDRLMDQDIENFSHAVRIKTSPDDRHPKVYYIRDGYFFGKTIEDPPKREGYIFLGYYTDDTSEELAGLCIRKDTDATARYVKKEDATKITNIYFARNDVCEKLERGDYFPQYKYLPENAQDKTITWTSSDESVATVDSNGWVKFISEGKTVITAHLSGGGSKSYNLTITDDIKNPETVTIEGGTIYLKPGEIGELKYSVAPAGAECELDIHSEDDEIVEADVYGLLYALKQGRTKVKVIASYFREGEGDKEGEWVDVSAECTVVVTDDGGSISTDVETEGVSGNASNLAEVVQAILTEDEKERLAAGENVRVWLNMKQLEEKGLSDKDKQILKAYMDKYSLTAGKYMDISLFKKIGDDAEQAVHDSVVPVKFTIEIPDELRLKGADANGTVRNADGSTTTRTFYLIRVHDDTADCVAKGTGDTLECSSALFSTYLLTYRDAETEDKTVPVIDDDTSGKVPDASPEKNAADNGSKANAKVSGSAGRDGKADSSGKVKTGDETFLLLWIAVLVIALLLGFIMLAIYKRHLDKRDKNDRG